MSTIIFSDSSALATDFAFRLFAGLLNVQSDSDEPDAALVERLYDSPECSTEDVVRLRSFLSHMRIKEICISAKEKDPDSDWSDSEIRSVRVLALDRNSQNPEEVLTFDVSRDYLDGEEACGWTRWRVKNVVVSVDGYRVELYCLDYGFDNRPPIWVANK
jgi:hypothetical protein